MSTDSYIDIVKSLPFQIEQASQIELTDLPVGQFNKILITGMGGSSITGGILQSYMSKSKIPIFVNRSYDVPEFVDRHTLVFVISYSGNTEETLSSLRYAFRKGSTLIAITSGGKLLKKFQDEKLPHVKIPADLQPRAALAFQFIPLIKILQKLKLLQGVTSDISKTILALKKVAYEDRAKSLAGKLIGKVPLVYASDRLAPVAYRWKTQFNENAKIHSFTDFFPELNHNELVGFTNLNASYYVIIIQDQDDSNRIKARMKLTRDIMSRKQVSSILIAITGDNLLARLFSAVYLGDLTSVYLAFLTNTDPEPVEIIEDFKKRLGKLTYLQ